MVDQKKQKENKNISGTVMAEIAGAVAIAGAAFATTMVLKDEKTREKIKEVAGNIKDQAVGYVKNIQSQAQDKKSEVEEKVQKVVDSAKE